MGFVSPSTEVAWDGAVQWPSARSQCVTAVSLCQGETQAGIAAPGLVSQSEYQRTEIITCPVEDVHPAGWV